MVFIEHRGRFRPAKKTTLGGLSQGTLGDDAVTVNQTIIVDGTTTTAQVINFTGANTHTGVETHTGAETHSGAEVFSNAAGVTTNDITERSAGAGTHIKTPVSVATTTLAPTALTSGTTYCLSATGGFVTTLPACSAANVGLSYKFKIITSVTGGGTYVINTTGTDVFVGGVYGSIAAPNATNDAFFGASTANKTITLSATTTCGLVGGWLEVTCVSATQWAVNGVTLGTGTIATPFSN